MEAGPYGMAVEVGVAGKVRLDEALAGGWGDGAPNKKRNDAGKSRKIEQKTIGKE